VRTSLEQIERFAGFPVVVAPPTHTARATIHAATLGVKARCGDMNRLAHDANLPVLTAPLSGPQGSVFRSRIFYC